MRNCWRYFMYIVTCEDCEFNTAGKNGLGLAAQHHDRTGHNVNVDVEGHVSYVNDEEHARREAGKTVQRREEGK